MRKSLWIGSFAACLVLLVSSSALAADKWLGTWNLSPVKSKSTRPIPKSLTLKFEASGDAITLTSDGVGADGTTMHNSYTSKWDGKAVPWEGNPDADMASPKRIDATHYSNVWKKDGKVTITAKGAVSKDGKTLTVTQTGKSAAGETVKSTMVYERQ